MKVVKAWALETVCDCCGVRLEVDVNDIRVMLVGNYGQTGNLFADQIPQYSVLCKECKHDIVVQKGFSGILPTQIKQTAEKNSGVDLNKIKYDRI